MAVLPHLTSHLRSLPCHWPTFLDIFKLDIMYSAKHPASHKCLFKTLLLLKGLISTIYNLISGLKCTPLNKMQMVWEKDIGLPLSDDGMSSLNRCTLQCVLATPCTNSKLFIGLIFPKLNYLKILILTNVKAPILH